ncbi:MAG: putative quinol monooxygenase [Bacteroidota bacterium]
MIIRLVRLPTSPERLPRLKAVLADVMPTVRQQPGCTHLELLADHDQPCVLFTLSHWQSDADLQRYRKSEVFGKVWPRLKAELSEKPSAVSLVSPGTTTDEAANNGSVQV